MDTTCSACNGDGSSGVVWDKLILNTTITTNVIKSYQVLECLDATEHAALTDTQKDKVQ